MDIHFLRAQVETSEVRCPTCEAPIDEWLEADPSEPGRRVVYMPRLALLGGVCPIGHLVELYVAELKAMEFIPHDVTERTLGRYVSQKDCTHGQKFSMAIGEGQRVCTEAGMIEGPADLSMCAWCGWREKIAPAPSPPARRR